MLQVITINHSKTSDASYVIPKRTHRCCADGASRRLVSDGAPNRVAVVASRVVGFQTATATAEPVTASREFEVNVPEADLAELRRRVTAT